MGKGKAILRGKHTQRKLEAKLELFIAACVLCPKCELPETDLVYK